MRILAEADQRVLLGQVLGAFGLEPVAVLDPHWPAGAAAEVRRRLEEAAESGAVRSDSLVFFTSGSTGRPRAVHRSARSWQVSGPVFTDLTGAGPDRPVCLPGPLHSTLFLFGAWHARSIGAPVILAGEAQEEAAIMHLVPAMLPGVLARRDRGELPALRTLVVAGDRLPPSLGARARGQGLRLVEYYGAAELSLVAARDDDGPFTAVEGVETRLVDGVLQSRSPYQAYGYLGTPEGGPLRRDAEGWADVGDLAEAVGDGFVVLGRGDAAVTTGGHTVVVEDVEAFLRGLPGIEDAAVVGPPHPRLGQVLTAVVVGEADEATLRQAVRDLPRPARPRRFVRRDSLPRTPGGKLLRSDVLASVCEPVGESAVVS